MRHIDIVKKAFVFTDIKDFTLKNSLLTQLQIRGFLNKQDELVFPIIKRFNGNLVKTIGDAYMIVFDDVVDALNASIQIQETLEDYNSKVKFNLYKIELRIIVNYGELQQEQTIIGEDYFGDIVNITSRLQYSVDENRIYVTSNVINLIKNEDLFSYVYLGKTSLRGVLYEIEVYEIIFRPYEISLLKQGKIKDKKKKGILMTELLKEKIIDISNIILELSLFTAASGMIRIPLIGLFIMLPFHFLLLKKIANKYGVKYLKSTEIKIIYITIFGSLFGIFLISKTVEMLLRTPAAWFIGYITFILNFLLTYVIGKFLNFYFFKKSQGIEGANRELKNMFVNKQKYRNRKRFFKYST